MDQLVSSLAFELLKFETIDQPITLIFSNPLPVWCPLKPGNCWLVFWWTWLGDLCVIASLPIVCWINITLCRSSANHRLGCDALLATRSCDCVILGDSCHVNTAHLLNESFLTEALAIPDTPQLRRHRSVPSIFISVNRWRCFIPPWLVWHMKLNRQPGCFSF